MTTDRYALVLALPACPWCHHPWIAHWDDSGCQAPAGPGSVCGCLVVPPDDPDPRKEETAA